MRDIRSAEIVLPCAELDPTLQFFQELGFVLRSILPADRPREATVEGHGLRLCLVVAAANSPGSSVVIRLHANGDPRLAPGTGLVAPNGTRIEITAEPTALVLPPLQPALVVTQPGATDELAVGRAGMRYRDLMPGRQGGRYIASHIHIDDGGPVPDYPHHHRVQFQLLYCHRGWVRVVYEDQGPPFVMRTGDAVLQPPGILHRVLECSPGLEVIEIICPAEHTTFAEPERTLPTGELRRDRAFAGQRFVWHEATTAPWHAWRTPGFACRDTGIAAASAGLADARVVRVDGADRLAMAPHGGDLWFAFVTAGRASLLVAGRQPTALREGSAITIPGDVAFALTDCSADFAFLEVTAAAGAG